MRSFALVSLFLLPAFASAACLEKSETIVYVNGVFSSKQKANADLNALEEEYRNRTGNLQTKFLNGYNESHLAGAGDLLKSWIQAHTATSTYVDDYDLDTILLNLHSDLTTRRVLFVGHSQGGYYTNALYDYLLAHGEPREALGVYNIATLDPYVAGGGKYLNSSGDSLLTYIKTIGFNPPPTNIDLISAPDDALKGWPGHALTSAYLAGASDRIVNEMTGELTALKASDATDTGACFTEPQFGVGYQAEQVFFGVADPLAAGVRDASVATYNGLAAAGSAVANFAATVGSKFANDTSVTVGGLNGISHAGDPQYDSTNFEIVKKLYGSSIKASELKDILGSSQGSAVALSTRNGTNLPADEQDHIPGETWFKVEPGYGGGGGGVVVLGASTDEPAVEAIPDTTPPPPAPEPDPEPTPVEDPVTTTPEEPTVPSDPTPVVLASQTDESTLCTPDWRACYTGDTSQILVPLGSGASFDGKKLTSISIAKDSASEFVNEPWALSIVCYEDSEYTQPCQPALTQWFKTGLATSTTDSIHWTANFSYEFDPAKFYQLAINDNGWNIGAYGSATELYWVIMGE